MGKKKLEESEVVEPKITRKRSRQLSADLEVMDVEVKQTKPKKNKLVNMNADQEKEVIDAEFTKNKLEDYITNEKSIEVLKKAGIEYLFPIQSNCYKHIFKGKDLIGKDRTGSGKTLAFAIPIIERLRKKGVFNTLQKNQKPYALILLPTRELAIQVTKEFLRIRHHDNEYRVVNLYGGTELYPQTQQLREGVEICIGTPGRIMDQYERRNLVFNKLQVVCLDEADQMLQLGFQEDVEKLFKFINDDIEIQKTQTLLFSATIPKWLHDIAKQYQSSEREFVDMISGAKVQTSTTVEHLALNCPWYQRTEIIGDVISCYGGGLKARCIIFCETKKECNDILTDGKMKQDCQVLHGDIPQKQREITFHGFKEGKFQCLVATNVASRGLDIPQVDLIIQLEPPKCPETYIHRSGRTARAGKKGVCITFYSKKHQMLIDRIERKAQIKFKKIGAPQPQELMKSACKDIVTSLKSVSNDCISLFKEASDELIEEIGASDALSRAIAYISGYTQKMKQRSLLCSVDGYVTYIIRVPETFRTMSYIWSFLKNHFSEELSNQVKGITKLKGSLGAVFDVQEDFKGELDEYIEKYKKGGLQKGLEIEVATSVPETEENNFTSTPSSFNNNNFQRNDKETNDALRRKDELEIFVGGLPYEMQEDQFNKFFQQKGVEFLSTRLLRDNASGQFRGVVFCLCKNTQAVDLALKMNGVKYENRALRINMSNDKNKEKRSRF